jgi:hypothetical protein
MKTKQVSVFVENKPGRLMSVLEALETRGISIKGMAVSDAVDIGIVRLILSNPDEAVKELRQRGFTTRMDLVLCVEISDVPGGLLHGVAGPLATANVNLQYFYAYTERSSNTIIAVIKADDIDKAEKALK